MAFNLGWQKKCQDLLLYRRISSFVAPDVTDVEDAFDSTDGLEEGGHPNMAEQEAYFTDSGIDWTNPENCPNE